VRLTNARIIIIIIIIIIRISTSELWIARKHLYFKVGVYTDEPVVWRYDALAIVDVGDVRVPPDSVKYKLCKQGINNIQIFN